MHGFWRIRICLLTALMLAGVGALASRLHEFQLERREEFLARVPGNRTVTIREPGTRGEITDRRGTLLARNRREYRISLDLEEIRNHWIAAATAGRGTTRAERKRIRETDIAVIVRDGPDSVLGKLASLGIRADPKPEDIRSHFLTHGGLVPYPLLESLSFPQVARVAEHAQSLPGVLLDLRPVRTYPLGSLAGHLLGYVKQWEKGDVPATSGNGGFDHFVGEEKGMAGVESSMDRFLRGPEGRRTVIKDEKGRTIGLADYTKPGTGARVILTIDARKQLLLERVLRLTGRAAGVIMDPRTGEVLAMASVPDYDPNVFIPGIKPAAWKELTADPRLSPLTNRAVSELTPGSTMKIPVALAGAMNGMGSRSFSCDGYVAYGSHKVGCWIYNQSKGSHGSLDLPGAIQRSCNPYFIKLANSLGPRKLADACSLIGFGRRTGIELPDEKPGILPGSPAWLARSPDAVMTPVLTAFSSIGQGDTLATPLQLCAVTACVANGGKYFRPRLIRKAVNEDGSVAVPDKPHLETDLTRKGVSQPDLNRIRKGMLQAVEAPGGTGSRAKIPGMKIAAKTGTAQTGDAGRKSHNSWMISFAPFENPAYAVCIVVQNGGSGGKVCGPLVNLVYQGLAAIDSGKAPKLQPQTPFPGNTDRIEEISPAPTTLDSLLSDTQHPQSESPAVRGPDPADPDAGAPESTDP
jgi:penicillin-binding protein 2